MARVEEKIRTVPSNSTLRAAVSEKIGLSSLDFPTFLELCKGAQARIGPLDSQADAIIGSAKAKYKGGNAGPVPPLPPQLIALQRAKDAIVRETIAAIHTRLSAEGRVKVGEYLMSLLGPNHVLRSK